MEPGLLEILVVRELRKIGFVIERPPRATRRALASEGDFDLEMRLPLGTAGDEAPGSTLVVARHEDRPMGEAAVRAVVERAGELEARGAVVFATGGFESGAVRAAGSLPVALLRVVDGRTAFDTGGWGAPGHYPAWLPEYVAQIATPAGPGLPPRYDITAAGQAERITRRLTGPS